MATDGPGYRAGRLPGPSELLPGRPDAVVDLQTDAGASLVGARWRYRNAAVAEIDFVGVGADLGPSGAPNRTYDVVPHAEAADFDDSGWARLAPADTQLRLGTGRVCFTWYRVELTIPEYLGAYPTKGSTAVFEVVVDDMAEVWVDGALPVSLGRAGGQVAGGFNAPNRVVLSDDVQPGQTFTLAILGINGPISASPRNYIWLRSATLDFYRSEHARVGTRAPFHLERLDPAVDEVVAENATLEQVAGGFEFTEGPVWTPDDALLFSSPNTNVIYRWSPAGTLDVFRTKSGYAGVDIGEYHQPGSNGLAFDGLGRLAICQHGNRRVIRVEPRGNITVLADRFEGKRLNSPNDLVYRSDGTLYFTDPPFGLPAAFDDPRKELSFSGVFAVGTNGRVSLVTDELTGPNGIAFSPDERFLYVGNWDLNKKVVMRYALADDGTFANGSVLCDLTSESGDDAIDGVKVDVLGNLYVCGPGGIWVLDPSGNKLGRIVIPESPHNLAWGDADRKTLYITALTGVYRIRLQHGGRRS